MALSVCWVCGAGLPDRDARRAHYASVHPGVRVTWRGRNPAIIEPGGAERIIAKDEQAKMQRAAAAIAAGRTPGKAGGRPKGSRNRVRIEALSGAPGGASPEPVSGPGSEPDAPSTAPAGPTRIVQPPVHPTVTAVQGSVRDAIRDSLDVTMLATIIRDLSVNLSEADGAGEAGHLSLTQSATIAKLVYDSTVDLIVNRFGGNVGRFKLALAVLVLVMAKGSIHARAIGAKVRARGLRPPLSIVPPPAVDDPAAEYDVELPDDETTTAPPTGNGHVPADAIADLRERQAAIRASVWAGDQE